MANRKSLKKITLKIAGMHCVSCAFDIDGTLEETEGVKKAQTNYAKAEVVIEFDNGILSEARIITLIQGIGYAASLT
ncbi:MAG: cation transporter [bacterium]|nr:cation transporter [bacterium]